MTIAIESGNLWLNRTTLMKLPDGDLAQDRLIFQQQSIDRYANDSYVAAIEFTLKIDILWLKPSSLTKPPVLIDRSRARIIRTSVKP